MAKTNLGCGNWFWVHSCTFLGQGNSDHVLWLPLHHAAHFTLGPSMIILLRKISNLLSALLRVLWVVLWVVVDCAVALLLSADSGRRCPCSVSQMTVRDFFDAHFTSPFPEPRFYLQQIPVADHPPLQEWLGDVTPPFCRPQQFVCTLFAGAAGITTSLHYDWQQYSDPEVPESLDNLFVQCAGRKKVDLWRPADHSNLYPRGEDVPDNALLPYSVGWRAAANLDDLEGSMTYDAPHVSRIWDVEEAARAPPDGSVASWPGFAAAHARRYSIELGPGDALYIPRWWWHRTTSLTAGTAINWWFSAAEEQGMDRNASDADGDGGDTEEEKEGHEGGSFTPSSSVQI